MPRSSNFFFQARALPHPPANLLPDSVLSWDIRARQSLPLPRPSRQTFRSLHRWTDRETPGRTRLWESWAWNRAMWFFRLTVNVLFRPRQKPRVARRQQQPADRRWQGNLVGWGIGGVLLTLGFLLRISACHGMSLDKWVFTQNLSCCACIIPISLEEEIKTCCPSKLAPACP